MITKERLAEIESMAKSPVAHELIAEVRRLQSIVEGVRAAIWDEGTSQARPPRQQSSGTPQGDAGAMIAAVLNSMTDDAPQRDFILSLQAGFEKYGKLTPKQFAALEKFHKRVPR